MQLQNKPKIAFDTNMLLAIAGLKVDVFSEAERMFGKNVEYYAPKQVWGELHGLAGESRGVEIALDEMKKHGVKEIGVDAGNADDALVKMAGEGYLVASNDAALRKRIKGFGGKVIYLRQSRILEIS